MHERELQLPGRDTRELMVLDLRMSRVLAEADIAHEIDPGRHREALAGVAIVKPLIVPRVELAPALVLVREVVEAFGETAGFLRRQRQSLERIVRPIPRPAREVAVEIG